MAKILVTPSASYLITCSRSLSTRIYSLGGEPIESLKPELSRVVKPHIFPVVSVTTDQSGTLFATGAADGVVKVWDIRGGYTTHTLHGHGSIVTSICIFSSSATGSKKDPAGMRLACGNEAGNIRVWNLQSRKTVATFDSHVSVVRSLEFHEPSRSLLSGSRDKTAMVWDSASWTLKSTIPILESVEACGFLNEFVIYTGGESGRIRLWSVKNYTELTGNRQKFEQLIVQTIRAARSTFILSVHADQTLLVHDLTTPLTNQPVDLQPDSVLEDLPISRRISGTHDEVIDLGFVGQHRSFLAVATNIENIRVLSLGSSHKAGESDIQLPQDVKYFGADVGLLRGHEDIVICLDVDWTGQWLVSGAKDNTARMWKIQPENEVFALFATFTGHAASIGAISLPHAPPAPGSTAQSETISNPPSFFVTGSQDKTIKRWETTASLKNQTRTPRATYTRKAHDKDINALDINHASKLFASASQDRTVKVWSLEDGEVMGVLRGHRRGVWTVRFAPIDVPAVHVDGSQVSSARGLILTGSGDKTVKIWSLVDYGCIRTFEGHTNSVLKVIWMDFPQASEANSDKKARDESRDISRHHSFVASAGGDGLVKVWDVHSNELAATLDNHTDRVWALAPVPGTSGLASGGADSIITLWKDTTSTTVAAAAAESTARVEQDQQLQNYMRGGSYREAITLALQLGHPARLLALFTSVVGIHPPEEGSLCGVTAVDEVLANLADEQLLILLSRLRDWNANARTAPVAQKVLWTIFRSYPPKRLIDLKAPDRKSKMKEILDGLRAYTERHYQRMEETIDESFLIDYTLQEMDQIGRGQPVNGVEASKG